MLATITVGTPRMKDPSWGESEQSHQKRHHWTDGSGNR